MTYCLILDSNTVVKHNDEHELTAFNPYTGEFDAYSDCLSEHVTMTGISDRSAETFIKAAEIARTAHAGQKDKGGEDYFKHPCGVVKLLSRPDDCSSDEIVETMTAAILHDVVEDTEVTLQDLRNAGIPETVLEAVDVLTKREEDDYFDYILKVKGNETAKAVKDADLRCNMNLSRIPNPGEKDLARVEKYKKARELLNR